MQHADTHDAVINLPGIGNDGRYEIRYRADADILEVTAGDGTSRASGARRQWQHLADAERRGAPCGVHLDHASGATSSVTYHPEEGWLLIHDATGEVCAGTREGASAVAFLLARITGERA